MKSLLRATLVVGVSVLLSGCGWVKGTQNASKAVEVFHGQFNDSKFKEIYEASTPGFKAAGKEADYYKFMEAIRRKLGAFKSGSRTNVGTNSTLSTTYITLTYKSEFERGAATETFIFVTSGDSAVLQKYNVSSTALVID